MNHSQGRGSVLLPHGTRKDGLNFQPNTTKTTPVNRLKLAPVETGSFTYGTIRDGAKHTPDNAVATLAEKRVFSRPEFMVLGLGMVNRKAASTALSVCLNPVPPNDLSSQRAGFQSHNGAKTMTTTSTRATAHTTTTPGSIPRFSTPATVHHDRLALQQRADNALSMALWHVRKGNDHGSIQRATGKAVSAARALKQLCAEMAVAA